MSKYFERLKKWNDTKKYNEECDFLISKLIKRNLSKKILDVGCGTGYLVDKLRKHGFNAIGIDTHKKLKRRKYVRICDAENMPFKPNSFDAVILMHSIGHMKNPKKVMGECHRVLKKKGVVFIMTPNKRFIDKIRWANKLRGYEPDPTCPIIFDENTLCDLMDGFEFWVEYFGKFPFFLRKNNYRERLVLIGEKL